MAMMKGSSSESQRVFSEVEQERASPARALVLIMVLLTPTQAQALCSWTGQSRSKGPVL